jgi:hypothetical protein
LDPISLRPDLPDWGVYLRWPAEGVDWIHPEDLDVAQALIPGPRVLKRVRWDGDYYYLQYGPQRLRVRPSLWLRVPDLDLEVGQQVEVLSCDLRNDPGIFRIAEIMYSTATLAIEYHLLSTSMELTKKFAREDLRPVNQRTYELL